MSTDTSGELRGGEHLPAQALASVQAALESLVATPEEIADAVMYIVSQPLRLNIADVVIRPAKTLVL